MNSHETNETSVISSSTKEESLATHPDGTEKQADAGSEAPDIESAEGADTKSAEPAAGDSRSEPPAEAPLLPPQAQNAPVSGDIQTIYLSLHLESSGGWDQRLQDTLHKLIEQAPPLLGSVGADFFYQLDLNVDKYFSVVRAKAEPALEERYGLTLTFLDQKIFLHGKPKLGFDGFLRFCFGREDSSSSAIQVHKKPLYIAADPRTLWQNLPVEDDEGYPAPDEAVADRVFTDIGKTALAASCRGRSHAHAGKPRDDSFLLDLDPATGWHFAAVADGAGSAKFSRKGSALACAAAVGQLRQDLAAQEEAVAGQELFLQAWKRRFDDDDGAPDDARDNAFRSELRFDDIMHRAVHAAYRAIAQEAQARGATVRDYHTTLLCAVFRKFSFGYFFLFYWVGDGAIALYNRNGRGAVLTPGVPDGGEFAGQTCFLTMMKEEINAPAIRKRTRYAFADDFEALFLMTDGVSDPFFPSDQSVTEEANWHRFRREILQNGFDDNPGCPQAFDASRSPEERTRALCDWLYFWSRGNHDDRTLVIIT